MNFSKSSFRRFIYTWRYLSGFFCNFTNRIEISVQNFDSVRIFLVYMCTYAFSNFRILQTCLNFAPVERSMAILTINKRFSIYFIYNRAKLQLRSYAFLKFTSYFKGTEKRSLTSFSNKRHLKNIQI